MHTTYELEWSIDYAINGIDVFQIDISASAYVVDGETFVSDVYVKDGPKWASLKDGSGAFGKALFDYAVSELEADQDFCVRIYEMHQDATYEEKPRRSLSSRDIAVSMAFGARGL